jgi:CBS domain containing-hemolysin-like protein
MSETVFILLILGLTFGLSFVFSGMEAGVLALSRLRILQQVRAGNPSAAVLQKLLDQPEDFLWTILIGNTVANFVFVSLALMEIEALLGGHPPLVLGALLAVVFVMYVFGELFPKTLFRRYPNRLSLLLARPFQVVATALWPLVRATAWMAQALARWTGGRRFTGDVLGHRGALEQAMSDTAAGLGDDERTLVTRVVELQKLTVSALTTPLDKTATLTRETPVRELLRRCREEDLARIVVLEKTGGRVLGVVSLHNTIYRPDLNEDQPVGALVQSALYLPETMRLERALHRLRQTGERLAVVQDRARRDVGIITLESILGRLFGDVTL